MSTGLETWNQNLLDVGPLYPFVGSEMILAILAIGSWIVWHVVQIRSEAKLLEKERREFSDKKKLEAAMNMAQSETLAHRVKVKGFDE